MQSNNKIIRILVPTTHPAYGLRCEGRRESDWFAANDDISRPAKLSSFFNYPTRYTSCHDGPAGDPVLWIRASGLTFTLLCLRCLPLPGAEKRDTVVQQSEAEGAEGVAAVSWTQARAHVHAHLAADVTAAVGAVAPVVALKRAAASQAAFLLLALPAWDAGLAG